MVEVSLALLQKIDKGCATRILKKTSWPMAGFRETSQCLVEGYVYANPGEAVAFTRADHCREIQSTVVDEELFLQSRQTWVLIPLPKAGGHQRLVYRWGADLALIGPLEQLVKFGQLGKA